jgi:hypothetical protein
VVDSILPPSEASEAESSEAGDVEELQRSATGEPGRVGAQFEHTLNRAVQRGGDALPVSTRSLMESRFGRDFSSVRVHSDAQADVLARGINARAFTLDNDIFFATSQFEPRSVDGQRLLAHELAHVVQQANGRVSRQVQRQTRCASYSGYDRSVDLNNYNCAGLALRTYQWHSPPSAVYDAIAVNFINPQSRSGNACDAGEIKFWLWEYDIHTEDDQHNVVNPTWQDFHIVAGRVDATGADPADVYSKNGKRPIYGPGTGPSFRPPARDRATVNDPSERPINTPHGRPVYKVRSNMTETVSCAGCHP